MKLFSKIFKRPKVKHLQFHTGTEGMKEHSKFIDEVNEKNIKIINAFVTYHEYSDSHKPKYLHYVIEN